MMLHNSGIAGMLFATFSTLFKEELLQKRRNNLKTSEIRIGLSYKAQHEELTELELGIDCLYNFINLYIHENPETSKEIFIYYLKKYIVEQHHFKHATLSALLLLKRMIANVEIYFDYIENTFKELGFLLLRNLRGFRFSIPLKVEILEILSQMA